MYFLIIPQRVQGFGKIGNRVQNKIVLLVKVGIIRTIFLSQGQKRKIVHKPLEHIAGFFRFSSLTYMGDVFRSYAALKIFIAYLVTSRCVREADGKVPFTVKRETDFHTFFFRKCCIYASILQVCKQGRRGKRYCFQMLETRLR